MRKPATLYFGAGLMTPPQITTSAVARVTSEAAFSIGSRLLSINDGILNAILGKMLGTNLSLRAMDYRALADTDVSAFSFLDALATELHMTTGTYDDVLSSTASVGQIASAMAHIPGLNPQAKVAAQAIGTSAATTLKLKNLIDVGEFGRVAIGEHSAGLDASMSLMDILTGSAAVANGNHQVDLNLGASVPGLLSARLELAIGEPAQVSPQFSIGEKGKVIRTAQTRALVTAGVGGPGGILGTSINLPVYVEVAQAEGNLANIACAGDTVSSVTVNARPGVASARIAAITPGSLDDFPSQPSFGPAQLITLPLVSVTGQSLVQVSNTTATPLTFNAQDIANNTARTVTTQNLTQSLTGSLLGNLNLNISVVGLGLGLGGLQSSLTDALSLPQRPLSTVCSIPS